MNNSKKPKHVDFGSFEKKLRDMGITSDIKHLSDETPPPCGSSQTPAPSASASRNLMMEENRYPAPPTSHDNRVASDWCNFVFGTLLSIYESTWVNSYGRRPTGRFLDFADKLTETELMRIIQHCRERLQLGDKWPPIMGELVVLKDQPTESELFDALSRIIAKQPANDIETWLMQSKSYELRRLAENQIQKKFREYYREALKLKENGKLKTTPIAIGKTSVKSVTDLKREEYEAKHGHQLNPRIKAILAAKHKTKNADD